jgi:hypothetical protein
MARLLDTGEFFIGNLRGSFFLIVMAKPFAGMTAIFVTFPCCTRQETIHSLPREPELRFLCRDFAL